MADEPARLLWTYCVVRADDAIPDDLPGLGRPVERIEHEGLAALVSAVPEAEYGEAVLPKSLNDFDWLARVARAHEAVLERAGEQATIVPLRLCTIFVDADGVERMLAERHDEFETALDRLRGCQEWTVKLLFDADANGDDTAPQESEMGSGTAYLLRRREERDRRAAAERLGRELAEDVHARLQDWAIDAVVRPPQNRELSGYEGDMLLNGAYLVEAARADELRALVADLREQLRGAGARLELGGPLPPFNFVAQAEPSS